MTPGGLNPHARRRDGRYPLAAIAFEGSCTVTKRSGPVGRGLLVGLVLVVALIVAACGGSTPAASGGGGGGGSPGASTGGGGGSSGAGGAVTGKRMCEIVTLDQATQLLGEAPPRGEASDDRLAKSHTCAYKPGPKAVLRVQVVEGIDSEQKFEGSLATNGVKVAAEGVGDKAYYIDRTDLPAGTRLYVWAKGHTVLIDLGVDGQPIDSLRESAKGLVDQVIAAI
jgi:hypothetical protein